MSTVKQISGPKSGQNPDNPRMHGYSWNLIYIIKHIDYNAMNKMQRKSCIEKNA